MPVLAGTAVHIEANDVSRLSRVAAGCAGVAVAVFGALPLITNVDAAVPAVALLPAGLALLLAVPGSGALRLPALVLAAVAAGLGGASLLTAPAAGFATLLAGLALIVLDLRLPFRRGGVAHRVADPLLAGAAITALVALVPRMFAPTFPDGSRPGSLMSPYLAGALLTLALGIILVRPETGPLRTADPAGPGTTIRRAVPVLIAVPVVAALVSALAVRSGVSRPAAAVSTGAILAALSVLVLVGYLVRSLERADRQQRDLVGELHERQEFAATLLESMNEAVMVLDAGHRVLDVNRRWRELTDRTSAETIGSRPDSLPTTGTCDRLVRRADGTDVPVLATMAEIPDTAGNPRAYVITYVDITDRKRAEVELSEHAAQLMAGNEQLREANTRLETALAFKNDLTSMLTHDVAQPISSIASLAELLASDYADLDDDIRFELATKIDKNTRRLIKMMNDLQLLFRLDTGSITAQRTPVPVREVVAAITAATGDGEVKLDIDDRLSALADRGHLTAVVRNLLSNALAYGAAPVLIEGCRTGDTVVLVVQDSGPGIPDELLPNLFDRFMRGAGLGLFIVRHLIEANGGTVRYEQAEPHGARLIVTLESASGPG